MTNLEKLITDLGGLIVTHNVMAIPDERLRAVACPFESCEDPDALEIEGCPSVHQCAECKRIWLAEADFKNDGKIRATTIMIDRDDVLALKGAAEILDGVRVMRRIMGLEAVKREA